MHKKVDSQPNKNTKTICGKGSVALLTNSMQLGSVFLDVEPPKSKSISRKGPTFSGLQRSVQFSKRCVTPQNREIKGPSQGVTQHSDPRKPSFLCSKS